MDRKLDAAIADALGYEVVNGWAEKVENGLLDRREIPKYSTDGNDAILFQMTGNFSINVDNDGDLNVIGENDNGTYYKHFVHLSRDITYIVEGMGTTGTNKYRYQINFNPRMIMPVEGVVID